MVVTVMIMLSPKHFEALARTKIPDGLKQQGWQFEPRQEVYGGHKVDFLFRSGVRILAVEAKGDFKSALDFMSRASALLHDPEVTEAMAVVPNYVMNDDLSYFAAYTSIGVAVLDTSPPKLNVVRWGGTYSASYGLSFSYPQKAS